MTPCNKYRDALLEAALGGILLPDLRAHLTGCAACATRLAALQAADARISDAFQALKPPAGPSPGFPARLANAMEAGRDAAPRLRVWRLAAATLAAAVMIAALLWQARSRRDAELVAMGQRVAEWRSPTGSLLRPPGGEFLSGAPKLGETYFAFPVLDAATETGGAKQRRKR